MITALIADDSVFMRKLIGKILSDLDIKVVGEASNGYELLELIRKYSPDLIILDINMPKMDGMKVLFELRKLNINARIIVITALSQEWVRNEAVNLGVAAFIAKPFKPDKLKEVITNVIRQKTY
ncbi:MAG: two-component system response regulator [Desulfurococcales archaeon ex4484_42]|nr:MAG: two-component system response regulator [Desulfurococcales archaeon ex4484_42]